MLGNNIGADVVARVKEALPKPDPKSADAILERIRIVLENRPHPRTVLYRDRLHALWSVLKEAHNDDPTAVEVDMAAALEHLVHCAQNTGWLFRHMDLHNELHTWEQQFEITEAAHDPASQIAEKDFGFMRKNVEHLNLLLRSGQDIQTQMQGLHLELNPDHLSIKYDNPRGGGGFARVYGGTYQGRPVAVKQISGGVSAELQPPGITPDEQLAILIKEARREVAILYKLQPSPHTIAVYGSCIKDGKACVVMEPAVTSLAAKLAASGFRTWNYMHSCQLIHRDLKPANILIDQHGAARIADVGVAASTASIVHRPAAYTPGYAPSIPSPTFGSDIHAFGKVMEDIGQGYMPAPSAIVKDACLKQQIDSTQLVTALLSIHTDYTAWDAEGLTSQVQRSLNVGTTVSVVSSVNFNKSKISNLPKVSSAKPTEISTPPYVSAIEETIIDITPPRYVPAMQQKPHEIPTPPRYFPAMSETPITPRYVPAMHQNPTNAYAPPGWPPTIEKTRNSPRVLTCWENMAKIWDVGTKEVVRTLDGHSGRICAVSASRNKQYIATSSEDLTVKVRNVSTGALVGAIQGFRQCVSHLALNRNGTRLVTAASQNVATLWDVKTGGLVRTLGGYVPKTTGVDIDDDGKTIVTALQMSVEIWDVERAHLFSLVEPDRGQTGPTSVAISPDGDFAVIEMAPVGEIGVVGLM
ncbi:hypothetical protein HDV00_000611 [Rhizophlyctis rosea]|nr:hypothetical protein HDV00_000611 [Rhizophlyctis rosea]